MCLSKPVILTFIKYCYHSKKGSDYLCDERQVITQLDNLVPLLFFFIHSFPHKSTAWFCQLLGPVGRRSSQQCEVVEHHVIFPRWFNAAPLLQDGGCHIRLCHGAACHPFIRPASNGIPFLRVPGDWARLGLTASQIHTESNTQTL